jgi:GNAT superfamily N-acetyltransferase
MSSDGGCGPLDLLVPLAWDSEHFGFPVARLSVPGDDIATAAAGLAEARRRRIALVYWQVPPDVVVPPALLAEFGGSLVDRKATFAGDLAAVERSEAGAGGVWWVREYPPGPASDAMKELAVAIGAFSRFARDPLFPREKFVSLYETWIDRSTRRELADVVIEAGTPGSGPLGVVTASAAERVATIGLIGVAAAARGKGLGDLLLRVIHHWMVAHGAAQTRVVTQLDNAPACRLYQRGGYHLVDVKAFYHFWPPGGRDQARS